MPSAPRDQASGLRRLFVKRAAPVIGFVSIQPDAGRPGDRAGVIRQFVEDFTMAGRSVTILDEHPAPGSIACAYGVSSRKDLKQALHGDFALDAITVSPQSGLGIISASRAAAMEFSVVDEAALAGNLALLRSRNAMVMVDCVNRRQRSLSPIACHADQLVVVVPAGNADLMQAYALIKRIAVENGHLPIAVVVARAVDATQARTTFDKLQRVSREHMGVTLQYQGAALTPGMRPLPLAEPMLMAPAIVADPGDPSAVFARPEFAGSVV